MSNGPKVHFLRSNLNWRFKRRFSDQNPQLSFSIYDKTQKLRFRLRSYHLGKILSFQIFHFAKNNKIQFYFYFKNSKNQTKSQQKFDAKQQIANHSKITKKINRQCCQSTSTYPAYVNRLPCLLQF